MATVNVSYTANEANVRLTSPDGGITEYQSTSRGILHSHVNPLVRAISTLYDDNGSSGEISGTVVITAS